MIVLVSSIRLTECEAIQTRYSCYAGGMNTLAVLGIALFVAGFVLMAAGVTPLVALIVVIVGAILARTALKDTLGDKLRQDRDHGQRSKRR